MKDLTELSKEIHETMKSKGFYDKPRCLGKSLMLCVTELAEAMQADREGSVNPEVEEFEAWVTSQELKGPGWALCYEQEIKDTLPQELAGAIVRILDLCAYLEIDIQKFVDLEMKYNKLRPHKHGKKY